jgi:hypothetical protein
VKRTLLLLAITAALAVATGRLLVMEDDPIRSLVHPDAAVEAVFSSFQDRSPFRGRVFVELDGLSAPERERVLAALAGAGYREAPALALPSAAELLRLSPLLSPAEVRALLDAGAVRARAEEALALATLPGGHGFLSALEADPAGLAPALAARLVPGGGPAASSGAAVRVFQSPSPLQYDRVGEVYDLLVSLQPRVHFIGADFYAVENYRAARRDVVVCSTLTLLLNLALFWVFTRRWALLGLLALGSVVSYLAGLLAVRAAWPQIFAVVLAYTSTFVGFNNEALVHLSGVEPERRARTLLGIGSAIGTTFIGFLVLLLGHSTMIRQMAVASIAGMIGFLLFLLPYRRVLAGVRFRVVTWPKLAVRPGWLLAGCAACAAGVALVGAPEVRTRVDGFRFETPALAAEAAHFSRRLEAMSLENVAAVRVDGSPAATLRAVAAAGLADPARHPLARWSSPEEQAESVRLLREGLPRAAAVAREALARGGVRDPAVAAGEVAPLGDWEYLELLGAMGPLRWVADAGGARWLFVGLAPGAEPDAGRGVHAMSPRRHYDGLLTGLSRELGWLFLAGLVAMAIYLAALQRTFARVLYVFAPLFVSALAFAVYARLAGAHLSIVHFMAFSLVIALAMDYTAVTVSGDHGDVEVSKVLLTGLSTLATFGVLVVAEHPVLRDLGATVAIGCGVSLAFALLVRLAPARRGA